MITIGSKIIHTATGETFEVLDVAVKISAVKDDITPVIKVKNLKTQEIETFFYNMIKTILTDDSFEVK